MVQPHLKGLVTALFIFALSFSLPSWARPETMFEGYFKIVSGKEKIGYFIQKYEFDAKTKQFISTYFIQTNDLGGNTSESLKAFADDKFQPISYQYTLKTPKMTKTIDSKFKGMIMNSVIVENGKSSQSISRKLPKGSFLSTFLGYLILQKGYSKGKKFNYSGVAEEEAESYDGMALIKEEQMFVGKKVFRIENTFKGIKFISFVTDKGEVLGTQSPLQKIATELVANANEATRDFTLPTETLKLLFGNIPLGKQNIMAQSVDSKTKPELEAEKEK
ncbi:MAG: hypothetical protein KDD35_05890 [Bdellovibrionales bacterium]|nr:hypothetical protein [Bdellovibrionales bacterium]